MSVGSEEEIDEFNRKRRYVSISGGMLSAIWSGTAPSAELYSLGQLGADSNGASTGLVYHVVGDVGSKSWVATGATVANIYGA